MSGRIENIIGMDNVLLNTLNNNYQTVLPENVKYLRANLNPINFTITSVLFIGICLLSFYSFFSFLWMIFSVSISLLISLFLTLFIFNIYRLSMAGVIGPASEYNVSDPNSIIVTYFIKFFFLLTIGSLFSYATYVIIIQKHNLENYFIQHPEIKPGILTLFSVSNNLGGIYTIAWFLFFLFIFILPQLILEIKVKKQDLKILARELDQNKLRTIFEKDPNYKTIQQVKTEWREKKLAELSNNAIFENNSLKRNIGFTMYSYLSNKNF